MVGPPILILVDELSIRYVGIAQSYPRRHCNVIWCNIRYLLGPQPPSVLWVLLQRSRDPPNYRGDSRRAVNPFCDPLHIFCHKDKSSSDLQAVVLPRCSTSNMVVGIVVVITPREIRDGARQGW